VNIIPILFRVVNQKMEKFRKTEHPLLLSNCFQVKNYLKKKAQLSLCKFPVYGKI
jgi:hypothetical protein